LGYDVERDGVPDDDEIPKGDESDEAPENDQVYQGDDVPEDDEVIKDDEAHEGDGVPDEDKVHVDDEVPEDYDDDRYVFRESDVDGVNVMNGVNYVIHASDLNDEGWEDDEDDDYCLGYYCYQVGDMVYCLSRLANHRRNLLVPDHFNHFISYIPSYYSLIMEATFFLLILLLLTIV
jgi:hypothetical protein